MLKTPPVAHSVVPAPLRPSDSLADKPVRAIILPPLEDPWWKRALDRGFALVLLLLTWPLIVLSMLLVKLTSPGPAIYSQTRLGKNGRPFTNLQGPLDDAQL